MEQIYFILFGWLLGLLSPPIASIIEKNYKRDALKKAIFSELENVVVRLAATCQLIQTHRGTRDKESLTWIKNIYEKYRLNTPQTTLDNINKLLTVSNEEFALLTSLMKAKENACLGFKKSSLPYLESVLSDLFLFDTTLRRETLEVRSLIDILNEDIENTQYYHRLTFDSSIIGGNRDTLMKNIDNGHIEIEKRCKSIVNKIIKLLDS